MSTIEKAIDVQVPVQTAYRHWSHFEDFPQFMAGVERVEHVTATRTHWRTRISGVTREFDAEITDQEPDRRIGWRSLDGPSVSANGRDAADQGLDFAAAGRIAGMVTFDPIGPEQTRVALAMDFEPEGMVEKLGDATNIIEQRIEGDLKRFKEFVESNRDPGYRAL